MAAFTIRSGVKINTIQCVNFTEESYKNHRH